jgi:hypothetical protein
MQVEWLTGRAAAQLLGVTSYMINRAAARGAIRATVLSLNGALVFSRADVERLAAEFHATV